MKKLNLFKVLIIEKPYLMLILGFFFQLFLSTSIAYCDSWSWNIGAYLLSTPNEIVMTEKDTGVIQYPVFVEKIAGLMLNNSEDDTKILDTNSSSSSDSENIEILSPQIIFNTYKHVVDVSLDDNKKIVAQTLQFVRTSIPQIYFENAESITYLINTVAPRIDETDIFINYQAGIHTYKAQLDIGIDVPFEILTDIFAQTVEKLHEFYLHSDNN